MSLKATLEDGSLPTHEGIFVDRERGVVLVNTSMCISLDQDIMHAVEDWDDLCLDNPEPGDEHANINLRVMLPLSLFQPHVVNVEIPQEFLTPSAIRTTVTEISTPINLNGTSGNVKITEEVKEKQSGVLHLIKKLLTGSQDDLSRRNN